jgi:hypothetical protein
VWGRAHHGRGSAGSVALNAMRSSDGSATGVDERPRGERGCSWCASNRERRAGSGTVALGSALLNGVAGGRGSGRGRGVAGIGPEPTCADGRHAPMQNRGGGVVVRGWPRHSPMWRRLNSI